MIWTREQSKALTDRALSFSKAEETHVIAEWRRSGERPIRAQQRHHVPAPSSGYSLAIDGELRQEAGR